MSRQDAASDLGEVYFEYRCIGAAVRVAAVHAATGTETVVMGPAHATTADMERLALGKLRARLARKREHDPEKPAPDLIRGGNRFSEKSALGLDPGIMLHEKPDNR